MFDPTKPVALSASGAGVFSECEMRGFLQYVLRQSADIDYVRPSYFAFGSAMHSVLEWCRHDHRKYKGDFLRAALQKENLILENHGAKLMAMFRSYFVMTLAIKTPLEVVAVETWFENDLTRGKVDLIVREIETGLWWIADVKGNGISFSPTKETELINDPQMNLYGAFVDLIAQKLYLDPALWAGIRYREIGKPKQRYKLGESFEDFHKRISAAGMLPARELVIPKEDLNWDHCYANYLETLKRARELQSLHLNGLPVMPRQNFNACMKWGSPCQFWSQCYKKLFTESSENQALSFL